MTHAALAQRERSNHNNTCHHRHAFISCIQGVVTQQKQNRMIDLYKRILLRACAPPSLLIVFFLVVAYADGHHESTVNYKKICQHPRSSTSHPGCGQNATVWGNGQEIRSLTEWKSSISWPGLGNACNSVIVECYFRFPGPQRKTLNNSSSASVYLTAHSHVAKVPSNTESHGFSPIRRIEKPDGHGAIESNIDTRNGALYFGGKRRDASRGGSAGEGGRVYHVT